MRTRKLVLTLALVMRRSPICHVATQLTSVLMLTGLMGCAGSPSTASSLEAPPPPLGARTVAFPYSAEVARKAVLDAFVLTASRIRRADSLYVESSKCISDPNLTGFERDFMRQFPPPRWVAIRDSRIWLQSTGPDSTLLRINRTVVAVNMFAALINPCETSTTDAPPADPLDVERANEIIRELERTPVTPISLF